MSLESRVLDARQVVERAQRAHAIAKARHERAVRELRLLVSSDESTHTMSEEELIGYCMREADRLGAQLSVLDGEVERLTAEIGGILEKLPTQ